MQSKLFKNIGGNQFKLTDPEKQLEEAYKHFLKFRETYPWKDDPKCKIYESREEFSRRYNANRILTEEQLTDSKKELIKKSHILYDEFKKTTKEEFGI